MMNHNEWNSRYDIGQAITYWPGLRSGKGIRSHTSSKAYLLEGHTAVVRVKGRGDCIALTHVQARRKDTTFNMTKREWEAMRWAALGRLNKQIAPLMRISIETVKEHIHHALEAMELDSRHEFAPTMVRFFLSNDMISELETFFDESQAMDQPEVEVCTREAGRPSTHRDERRPHNHSRDKTSA